VRGGSSVPVVLHGRRRVLSGLNVLLATGIALIVIIGDGRQGLGHGVDHVADDIGHGRLDRPSSASSVT